MRTETKVLIVLIVMILSVGPLEYFFGSSQPKPLEVPEQPEKQPTTRTLAANITGTVLEIQPYISYVGIAPFNNREYVAAALEPLNLNYSLEVSLNPRGEGFQYAILVPVNDTDKIKEVGFRLIYRLSQIFDPTESLPLTAGKLKLPQNFTYGNATVTLKGTEAAYAAFLYSAQLNGTATVSCSDITTSANYRFVKIGSACYDVELSKPQPYFGLSEYDVMFSVEHETKVINASVVLDGKATIEATFDYGANVSKEGLEGELNESGIVTSVEAQVQPPQNVIMLRDTNASLINITGAAAYQDGENATVMFGGDLNGTLERIRDQLGYLPEYSLGRGSLQLTFGYDNETVVPAIEWLLSKKHFTVEKTYMLATLRMPLAIHIGNAAYEPFRIRTLPIKLRPGTVPPGNTEALATVRLSLTIKYSEIIDADAEQVV